MNWMLALGLVLLLLVFTAFTFFSGISGWADKLDGWFRALDEFDDDRKPNRPAD